MASYVKLDDISFGDDELDALFQKWREAIEQANNWSVSGAASFQAGPAGYALNVGGRALEQFSIRITGGCISSGAYPWEEVTGGAIGTWTTTGRSGTTTVDPAYETILDKSLGLQADVFPAWRDPGSGEVRFEGPGRCLAKNGGSTIAAESSGNPGSGTVTLYYFDGTSMLTTGFTTTAWNMTSTTVAASKYLQMKRINGKWFVDVESCA